MQELLLPYRSSREKKTLSRDLHTVYGTAFLLENREAKPDALGLYSAHRVSSRLIPASHGPGGFMKLIRCGLTIFLITLVLSCQSSKLTPLLPDAPDGWKPQGSASTNEKNGVGHSSTRSYVPANGSSAMGVQRVTVQILIGDKGADQKQLQAMALESKAMFKERKQIAGFPAYESFPLPDNDTHSLDILPASGKWVQIVAYKGGPEWENGENRKQIVSAFAAKVDLKKIAAQE
jgi:hypothetical protein